MPVAGRADLSAIAEQTDSADDGAIFVPGLAAVRHILIDAERRQHVLVRLRETDLQIQIDGADILNGAVNLTFVVRGIDILGRSAPNIADLRHVISEQTPADPKETHWTTRTINRRDAYIVHDCIVAGATYREAATVLYGREITQHDWRNSGIRDRIRRHWARAQHLVSGGYQDLLK